MPIADSIPTAWYLDPAVLQVEREHVFRPYWHYVGSAEAVREPGSYQAVRLGDLPVVVTRDTDGALHALANVCRHRGALVAEGCGRRKTLQCVYHGWTYDLDGALRKAPGVDAAAIDCQVLAVELRDHPELAPRLRVIDTLGPSGIQPVVASCRLPEADRAAARETLLALGDDPAARAVLAHGFVERFAPVTDADYDSIRAMLADCGRAAFMELR